MGRKRSSSSSRRKFLAEMLGWIATVTGIISNLQNMFGRGAPPAPVAPVMIDVFDRVSVVVTPETAAIAIAGTNAATVVVS
jgi:hypothetical protein